MEGRTGIVNSADVYDDVQIFQYVRVSGTLNFSLFKVRGLLQQKATQRLITVESPVVSTYLDHFGFCGQTSAHHTNMPVLCDVPATSVQLQKRRSTQSQNFMHAVAACRGYGALGYS